MDIDSAVQKELDANDGAGLKSKPTKSNKKAAKPKTKKKAAERKPKAKKRKTVKAKKKKSARKSKAGAVVRSERLDMRLTKAEKAKIYTKAKKTRRTVTSLVIEAIEKIR